MLTAVPPLEAYPPYQPTAFARAVAAMVFMQVADNDDVVGMIHMEKPTQSGWRVWAQVADWRVEDGDVLYGNFEVRDKGGPAPVSRHLLPLDAVAIRKAWATKKAKQLKELVHSPAMLEVPLYRWIAAFMDVATFKDIERSVKFQLAIGHNTVELSTHEITLVIRPAVPDLSTGWEVALRHQGDGMALFPKPSMSEAHAVYELLEGAWIQGRRQPGWPELSPFAIP